MVWTTEDDVRLLTGLTTTDISDNNLDSLIEIAQKEVLLQVNNIVNREKIEYIDESRENKIDGSNTTYYIKNWKNNFLSDYNYDLEVTISDIVLVSVDSSGTETSQTADTISYTEGKFTVASALNNVDLYVTYAYSQFNPVTPNSILKLAAEYLAGAYAYMRIDSSQKKSVRFGNVSITNGTGKDSAYSFLYNKYMEIIRQLNENLSGGAVWGESHVLI